jgi:hypothetical protein
VAPSIGETTCFHGVLAFRQGGFNIYCVDCGAIWRAVNEHGLPDYTRDVGLAEVDERVAQRRRTPPPSTTS